jgi:hypothetical protein
LGSDQWPFRGKHVALLSRLAPLLPTMTPGGVAAGGDPARSSPAPWSGAAPGSLGGTCRSALGRGDGLRAVRPLADRRHPGPAARRPWAPRPTGLAGWAGTPRSTPAWCGPTSPPPRGEVKGLGPIPASRQQALGWSRGGLTTKLHTTCDGRGRKLATHPTPGPGADTSQLVGLVDAVRVARSGGRGRPRTRVARLTGDKAYSSRANRAALGARHIGHTRSEPWSCVTGRTLNLGRDASVRARRAAGRARPRRHRGRPSAGGRRRAASR